MEYDLSNAKRFSAERNGKPIDIIIGGWPEKVINIFGYCTVTEDRYLVLVNDRAPSINKSLGHELAHIFCGHLDDGQSYSKEMEREADRKAFMYYKLWELGLLDSIPGCKAS